jgi:hypothetical protein
MLHQACVDGEPQRLRRRRRSDRGQRPCRAGRGAAPDRAARQPAEAITLGADKAYNAEDFVNEPRSMNATPHVAQNTSARASAIDGRTRRHTGYAIS